MDRSIDSHRSDLEIQHHLGADIFLLDEPTSPNASREYQIEAMDRTHCWAARSLKAHRTNVTAQKNQALRHCAGRTASRFARVPQKKSVPALRWFWY